MKLHTASPKASWATGVCVWGHCFCDATGWGSEAALAIKADKNAVFPWACKWVTHRIASWHAASVVSTRVFCHGFRSFAKLSRLKLGTKKEQGQREEETIGENRPVCADVVEVISVRIVYLGPLQ